MVRGLVLDKKRGNILKVCLGVSIVYLHYSYFFNFLYNVMLVVLMLLIWLGVLRYSWICIPQMDRHKYVKVAYHGFQELSKEDKVMAYGSTLIRDAFDEPDYALIDTLFSLAEAFLFAQLVDFKDNNPGLIPEATEYGNNLH